MCYLEWRAQITEVAVLNPSIVEGDIVMESIALTDQPVPMTAVDFYSSVPLVLLICLIVWGGRVAHALISRALTLRCPVLAFCKGGTREKRSMNVN